MSAGSAFSDPQHDFTHLLRRIAGDWNEAHVLTARNFLLDENVLPQRSDSYFTSHRVGELRDGMSWQIAHNRYLAETVHRPSHGGLPGDSLDYRDPDVCPETFHYIDPTSPYQWADDQLHLIRVEQLGFVARASGESTGRIRELAERQIDVGDADANNRDQLAAILDTWLSNIESRPMFATFWNDVADLFGETPGQDQGNWADELRDRLGLLHLNPASRGATEIDVLIFRYPIAETPLLQGVRDRRPLVPPTVLDATFSPPFCPAPRGERTGFVVHLQGNSDPLRQELLHPRSSFKPKHLWRVGSIRRSIDGAPQALKEARAFHLLAVRERTNRTDYASDTDGDLLT